MEVGAGISTMLSQRMMSRRCQGETTVQERVRSLEEEHLEWSNQRSLVQILGDSYPT